MYLYIRGGKIFGAWFELKGKEELLMELESNWHHRFWRIEGLIMNKQFSQGRSRAQDRIVGRG